MSRLRPVGLILVVAAVSAACGGGSSGGNVVVDKPTAPPVIESFLPTPWTFTTYPGEPMDVDLAWKVKGAAELSLTIDPPVAHPPSLERLSLEEDHVTVPVDTTTTFTLIARNKGGEVSNAQKVVVRYRYPPGINQFDASPGWAELGDPVELTWSTNYATAVTITRDGVPLEIPPSQVNGTFEDFPPEAGDVVYLLRATDDADHEVTKEAKVLVRTPDVDIDSFTVTPERALPGAPIVFAWETTLAVSVDVQEGLDDSVPGCATSDPAEVASGSCEGVAPTEVGVHYYYLNAKSEDGHSGSAFAKLTVGEGPLITFFWCQQFEVDEGEPATLRWKIKPDIDGVLPTLTITDDLGNEYDASGANPLDGSIDVFAPLGSRTFTLVASTPGTPAATDTAKVDVVAPD